MLDTVPPVLPHHQAAARMWGSGGEAYNAVSFRISDALAHAAQRLNPQPRERILDIATGTGWSARNVAAMGAEVVAVDIAEELLSAARSFSGGAASITYHQADAERLPFPDDSFDGIISTFGVMFATDQRRAAAEMARVCKAGGRIALTAWTPGTAVAEFFGLIAKHGDAPPPKTSPIAWGDPEAVQDLLGAHFDLVFERGVSHAYHADPDDIWDWYVRGFGPLRQLALALDEEAVRALKADVDAYHRHYATDCGLRIPRDYLLILGRRR